MLRPLRTRFSQWRKVMRWKLRGAPLPPPHAYKIVTVRSYARRFGTRTLVETGTFMGDMIEAQKESFDTLVSIELAGKLYERARQRFAGDPRIQLHQGDSGDLIAGIVARQATPALFWLDGHYSGGETALGRLQTPIVQELTAVLGAPQRHVVLIDDARCFTGSDDYPTVESLRQLVLRLRPGVDFRVEHDIIRITPGAA